MAAEVLTRKNGFFGLSDEAKKHLLPIIVAESTPAGKIRISELIRKSVDGPIKVELGDQAEISIVQFVGALLLGHEVVGSLVIAYLKELPVWTVRAYWLVDEWYLDVYPVADPDEWDAGYYVLSGDSTNR